MNQVLTWYENKAYLDASVYWTSPFPAQNKPLQGTETQEFGEHL